MEQWKKGIGGRAAGGKGDFPLQGHTAIQGGRIRGNQRQPQAHNESSTQADSQIQVIFIPTLHIKCDSDLCSVSLESVNMVMKRCGALAGLRGKVQDMERELD